MSSVTKPQLKESLSLKILYWLASLFYFMIIGGLILFFLTRILSIWDIYFDFASTIGVRLDKSLVESTEIKLSEELPPIKISRTSGIIDLADLRPWFAQIINWLGIFMITAFIYVLNRLRMFVRNIKNDKIFDLLNIKYLTQAAYALFVYGFFNDIVMRSILTWYFRGYDEIKFSLGMDEIFFNNGFVFGMILIVIAAIFKRGILLKNEAELTI
jgi:hypothetical protein